MKPLRRYLPVYIRYILKIYLAGIVFFTIFRLLLLILEWHKMEAIPHNKGWIMVQAFFMGWRFDTVISGYILALPLLVTSIAGLGNFLNRRLIMIIHIYISLMYSVAFLICTIDIPYFRYFFSRLTTSALAWIESPSFVVNMILQESSYAVFIIPFILLVLLWWVWMNKIRKQLIRWVSDDAVTRSGVEFTSSLLITLLFMGLTFLGIRGRADEKAPIQPGTAFFSPYAFPNQLGLNPVFTFIRSLLDDMKPENRVLNLMPEQLALDKVQQELQITPPGFEGYPVARWVTPVDPVVRANVVLVIMESMSAQKMGMFGNSDKLTPFLDSLAKVSYSFDNAYTAGIHTYNGIFSSLYGHPALLKQHPMKRLPMLEYAGLPNVLRKEGYQTVFFITHDPQFDNTGGFLSANGFEEIVSKNDYPQSKVMSTLGVPDDYLFEYGISRLNNLNRQNRPFLAGFMTASDHGPYIIPEDIPFKPKNRDIRKGIVEYADWSCRKFISLASIQPWFMNTIFVFVADHGWAGNSPYDLPLPYHHTPLIIYAPGLIKEPASFSGPAGQIDIPATVLGMLHIKYINNTLGIDLLREKRPFIYFSADDKIGCVDEEFFYIRRMGGKESLYSYRPSNLNDLTSEMRQLSKEMRDYSHSMMQASQIMIKTTRTGIPGQVR